jgi:beta-lactamase class A
MTSTFYSILLAFAALLSVPVSAQTGAGSVRKIPVQATPFEKLATSVQQVLQSTNAAGLYGIYIEDLETGQQILWNAEFEYDAWSLLKVPILVTVLQRVQQGEIGLQAPIPLPDIDMTTYGPEDVENIQAQSLPLEILTKRLMELSDNQASVALAQLFKAQSFQQTLLALGIAPAPPELPRNTLPRLSARECGNMLRILYRGACLTPKWSQYALSLMSETLYDGEVQAVIPKDIRFAHKVGFNADAGDFHNIGILYFPDRPVIVCIMSGRSTREEADRIIPALLEQVVRWRQ